MKVWVVLAGQAYEGYDIVGIYESEEVAKMQELETLRSSRYDFVKIQEDFVIRSETTRNEGEPPSCPDCGLAQGHPGIHRPEAGLNGTNRGPK